MTIEKLQSKLEETIRYSTESIKLFTDKLLVDPFHELSWSSDILRHAAQLAVAKCILGDLNYPSVTMELLKTELTKVVVRGAKYPERSTSPISNLMKQEKLAVYAAWLEELN